MAKWEIVGQFTVEADTPDAAIAWLKAEMAAKLRPGEAGKPLAALRAG